VLRGLLEASFTEHDVDKHAASLKGLPILARVGMLRLEY
jgi:hypothetical protein